MTIGTPSRRNAMVQIFQHRSARLLITGQTISNFGDGISSVAFTILVIDLTHRNAALISLFAAARLIPLVGFLLVGGVIVDRHSRRLVLLTSDVARTLVTGGVVVLAVTGLLHFWMLIVAAVIFGAFDALFMPAISALMPEIVPEDLLTAMNSVRPLSNNLAGGLIGPAVGGFIAAWSTSFALGVDAVTFVASASALALMRAIPKPVRLGTPSMIGEIKEGLHFVRSRTWLWSTLALAGMTNAFIFIPTFTFMGLFIEGHLHAAKFWIGLTMAAGGVSGTIGTLVIGSRPPPRRRIKVMYAAWITAGVAALIYCFATSVWILLVLPLVMFPLLSLGNIIWETMLQKETPQEMLGRVSSADWFVSLAISPPAIAIAGALIGAFGFAAYFAVAVFVCEVPCVVAMFSRTVNTVDRGRTTVPEDLTSAPGEPFVSLLPAEMAPPPLAEARDHVGDVQ